MAFVHVDDAVRHLGIEADKHAGCSLQRFQGGTPAAARRRQVRLAHLRRQSMLLQRRLDPGGQVAAIRLIVGVLELASAAFGKMPARRLLMMWSKGECAIVENGVARHAEGHVAPARGDPVAARGNADDEFVHREAMAAGIAAARSSAISCGPAISAALPCSQTPALAASNAGNPRARIAAISPASTSPVPALASHGCAAGAKPRRPSGAATSVSGPL